MATFVESAYTILEEEGKPMTAREITEKAMFSGLLTTKGKTPSSTLGVAMRLENESRLKRNNKPRFKLLDDRSHWTLEK